jgi:mono/diheme cytochrome c family protein
VWFLLVTAWAGFAVTRTAAAATEPDGRALYLRYCASCHGAQGRGDGPDADVFAEKPRDLREGFLQEYSVDDLVRRVREGAPLQLGLDLPALKARASEVNALVSHLKRLPAIDWDVAASGWDTYADRCVACHGEYGAPGKGLPAGVRPPRDLSDPAFQRTTGDEELVSAVRHGREGMPALVPRIPEGDGLPLATFVRLLSPGFRLYSRYCASCHGDDGLGAEGPPGSLQVPAVRFDEAYFRRTDPEHLNKAVWHMTAEQKPAMPHYRWTLTEAQTRAIVEYLRASSSP